MSFKEFQHIGILGAGLMGHGIAQVFAQKGFDVALYDRDAKALAESLNRIRSNMGIFISMGLLSTDQTENVLNRVHIANDLASMCEGRDFILEAISENLQIKRRAFAKIEQHVSSETILSSNTSAIPISSIAEGLLHPDRVLGTHFWNPPHIIPCVEVIKADQTSDNTFETTFSIMERAGKIPVRVMKDVPGFLGNRMQHALWREAIKLVENGIANAEDVDKVVRNAFGLRLAFLGPLETADLAGLELTRDVHQDLFPSLDCSQEPSELLKEKIRCGATGAKSGEGFHSWPPEKLSQFVKKRDKVFLKILQQVNADENDK